MNDVLQEHSAKPVPLAGLRVLDIASLYAASLAATILGDFGAEVIKVEPPGGEGFRGTGMWPVVARNKKSISLNLREPEGCELLRDLIAHSDVLIENYPERVLKKRGISWADLSAVNSRLVMVSVSCYGQSGPYADRPGSGTISEGFAGLTSLIGNSDGPPMLASLALGDGIGALNMVIGTMMALYWRDVGGGGGRGQQIDASLYEPILAVLGNATGRWQKGQSPRRCGSRLPGSAIRNVYATADGQHVVMSASTQRHVDELIELAGGGNDDDANIAVARWIKGLPLTELLETVVARRIPVAPVNDLDMLLADQQVKARGSLIQHDDPELGEVALAAPSPRLIETPGSIRWINPGLAEHNSEIYGGLLGLNEQQQSALQRAGVV